MTKPTIYLVQFAATLMIIIGGMCVVCDIVCGEHNFIGWAVVVLGVSLLIFGSRHSTEE